MDNGPFPIIYKGTRHQIEIQVRGDGDLDYGFSHGDDEKWLDSK